MWTGLGCWHCWLQGLFCIAARISQSNGPVDEIWHETEWQWIYPSSRSCPVSMKRCGVMEGAQREGGMFNSFLKAPSQVALLHVSPCDCASPMKRISLYPEMTTEDILAPVPPGFPNSEIRCHGSTPPYVTSYHPSCYVKPFRQQGEWMFLLFHLVKKKKKLNQSQPSWHVHTHTCACLNAAMDVSLPQCPWMNMDSGNLCSW